MKLRLITLILTLMSKHGVSQNSKDNLSEKWERMHQPKEQALQEFNEAKFGMFIHCGVYSLPAGIWKGQEIPRPGEWIMYRAQIPRDEYLGMAKDFNPVKFDAEKWVKTAKEAGMKYIVAMPKHHDGFAMYDSKVTTPDIVDQTKFGRDPMEEIYNACKKYGLKFSIYYSHATDWLDGGDAGVRDYLESYPDENKESESNSKLLWPSNTWDSAPVCFTEYLERKAKSQMEELL